MKKETFFYESIIKVALPITVQSLIQASFSVVDQLMVGRIGEVAVAGIGLGGKFASLYAVIASAIAAVAGILIAQYVGNQNDKGISKSFYINSFIIGTIALLFSVIGVAAADDIMSVYSKDMDTIYAASEYLWIIAISFIPLAGSLMLSTVLRCKGYVKIPLYASIASATIDTGLSYLLIFGKAGFPKMGVEGAAWATTIARFIEAFILLLFVIRLNKRKIISLKFTIQADKAFMQKLLTILFPILVCEFLWSLGENVYAVIYGRIGTDACAAMTLTSPIQSLMIGALTGVSAAAGIIVGKRLGEGAYEKAYGEGKKLLRYGIIGASLISVIILLTGGYYVQIFNVEDNVRLLTKYLLIAYAIIAPVKVGNMILGGGIIRSGGKTKYIMGMDVFGTWCIGVPLGLFTGFVLHLPIYQVYFILSLEEIARLIIGLVIFRKKIWINQLT
jgi:putative MATE family efflux protein